MYYKGLCFFVKDGSLSRASQMRTQNAVLYTLGYFLRTTSYRVASRLANEHVREACECFRVIVLLCARVLKFLFEIGTLRLLERFDGALDFCLGPLVQLILSLGSK